MEQDITQKSIKLFVNLNLNLPQGPPAHFLAGESNDLESGEPIAFPYKKRISRVFGPDRLKAHNRRDIIVRSVGRVIYFTSWSSRILFRNATLFVQIARPLLK